MKTNTSKLLVLIHLFLLVFPFAVAAMVALKRVQNKKIALDENINNNLVTWKLPDNEFTAKKKVTLANLLSHTAGLA